MQKLLPNADITVDRFHVIKIVNDELNAARRELKIGAGKLDNETEKFQIIFSLKHSKYLLLKAA